MYSFNSRIKGELKMLYKMEIYLTCGFSAIYKDITIEQAIREIKNYKEIDSISIKIQKEEQ